MSKNSELIFCGQHHYLTSPFMDPSRVRHLGTDYGTKGAAAVQHCPLDGGIVHKVVTKEEVGNPRGLYIEVQWPQHNLGLILQHADMVLMPRGKQVDRGDPLITTGMTGRGKDGKRVSTGVHAHVEIYRISTGERMDFETFDWEGFEMSYEKWKEYQERYEKEEAAKPVQEPASEAWAKAERKGIMKGKPRGAVTREVLAIVLDRLGLMG